MSINKLILSEDFSPINIADENSEITSIYCCDLLSMVMGRALEGSAWITVMANTNSLAVASLADVSCIILSEGMQFTEEDIEVSKLKGINVIKTNLDTYNAAIKIKEMLGI